MPKRSQQYLRHDFVSSVEIMRAKRDISHASKDYSTLRKDLQKFCELIVDTQPLWSKDQMLSSCILSEIHLFIGSLPEDERALLRFLFHTEDNILVSITKLLGNCTINKKTIFTRNPNNNDKDSKYHVHKQLDMTHTCLTFGQCVMAESGLCLVDDKAKITKDYVYFKEEQKCIHVHTDCYLRYISNDKYLAALWQTTNISFANPALYHIQPVREPAPAHALNCCECLRTAFEMSWEPIQGIATSYYLYYGSLSVNKHIICEGCHINGNKQREVAREAKCAFCGTYANPYTNINREKQDGNTSSTNT
jgi:hypothetical protein